MVIPTQTELVIHKRETSIRNFSDKNKKLYVDDQY